MSRTLAALALSLALQAALTPARAGWTFSEPVDLAGGAAAFPHLDASGRQALAVSAGRVALAWEDSRTTVPRCHVALRDAGEAGFREFGVGGEDCFAPAVAALEAGRFAVIWEDGAGLAAALVDRDGPGPALRLAASGSQGSLAWHPRLGLFAAWSAPEGRRGRVWRARLATDGMAPRADAARPADPAPPADDQLHPVLAATADTVVLAWEDRRHGHTVVYASASGDGADWSPPLRVSLNPSGHAAGTDLGRGSGAMRPALAHYGRGLLAAVWLDKRDFLSGYDVYAALSGDGGRGFGKNLKVQDSFGDSIAQWHAAAAGNARGDLVVAWDDDRDGSADIWLSWLKADGAFADNLSPPPASGPGSQTDPAIALDDSGELHLAWVERSEAGIARLRYARGRPDAP